MIYYLSFWYKRKELAFRISLCMTGELACLSSMTVLNPSIFQELFRDGWGYVHSSSFVSSHPTLTPHLQSLIAFGLVRAKTSVLTGWQFLYLIEVGSLNSNRKYPSLLTPFHPCQGYSHPDHGNCYLTVAPIVPLYCEILNTA